jgi:hypothetical protein
MSFVYRRVDFSLAASADTEVREGDRLLLEVGRLPRSGELALVRRGKIDALCRWERDDCGDVLGVVIGVKRKL